MSRVSSIPRPSGDWLEFLRGHGGLDSHVFQLRALSTQVGASGGFAVPGNAIEDALAWGLETACPMLRVATVIPTAGGGRLSLPTDADDDGEGEQLSESAATAESDPTIASVAFGAFRFGSKMVKVPQELLEDAGIADIGRRIGAVLAKRLGRIINRRLTTGIGVGQPRGIVPAAAAGATAQSATAIDYPIDLPALLSALDNAFLASSTWMFSASVYGHLLKQVDGAGRPQWDGGPLLYGRPWVINEHMTATMESGARSIILGDLSKYIVRLARDVRISREDTRYRETDQTGFCAFARADGDLSKPSGKTPVVALVH
jgi:HK97 family phage major capsid protein